MLLDSVDLKVIESAMEEYITEQRPLVKYRLNIEIDYVIIEDGVEILEISPHWRNNTLHLKTPIAKAKYLKSKDIWEIYWKRKSSNWIKYLKNPQVKSLNEFVNIVSKDDGYFFFG